MASKKLSEIIGDTVADSLSKSYSINSQLINIPPPSNKSNSQMVIIGLVGNYFQRICRIDYLKHFLIGLLSPGGASPAVRQPFCLIPRRLISRRSRLPSSALYTAFAQERRLSS